MKTLICENYHILPGLLQLLLPAWFAATSLIPCSPHFWSTAKVIFSKDKLYHAFSFTKILLLIWIKVKLFPMIYSDLPGQGTTLISDCVSFHCHSKLLPCPFSALKHPSLFLCTCCFFHLENSFHPSRHLDLKSHISVAFYDQPLQIKEPLPHIQLFTDLLSLQSLFLACIHSWNYVFYWFGYVFTVYL